MRFVLFGAGRVSPTWAVAMSVAVLRKPCLKWQPNLTSKCNVFVAEEEALGDNGVGARSARRAARYTLYRKFVYVRWGYLGSGKRVRIPQPACVVEFIHS